MRILLIKTSSMGDIVHTLPAVSDVQQIFPGIIIDWVIEEDCAEIPLWHNAVKAVIPVALRRWRKNWVTAWQQKEISEFLCKIRAVKYDHIIDAQGLYKSALIARLARGRRSGYSFYSIREPLATLCYRHRFKVPIHQHAVTRIRQLFAEALGYKIANSNEINYGIRDRFIETLNTHTSENRKYLTFIHSTSREEKCWQEEKWVELCRIAHVHNFNVLLPWGNEEEHQRAERIASLADGVQVLPKLSLTEIAKLLTNSCGVVAVDTGLGHLAAALEKPTLSLYGPTLPSLIGTWGKKTLHITGLQNVGAQELWEKFAPLILNK